MMESSSLQRTGLSRRGGAASGATGGIEGESMSMTGTHPFLMSKFQVGSSKSRQKINYSLGEKVFHQGDVPKEVQVAKRQVNKSKQANILDTEPRAWNQSSIADPKIQKDPQDLKRQLLKVRAGLMDEKTLKPSRAHSDETVAELHKHIVNITGQGPIGKCTKKWFNAVDERGLPSHTIADQWPDWSCSVSAHTKEDIKQAQQLVEEKDQRRRRMMTKDPKLDTQAYVDPVTAIANVNDRLRERKIEFQDLKDQFKRELKVEFPQASEERLQAMAQRYALNVVGCTAFALEIFQDLGIDFVEGEFDNMKAMDSQSLVSHLSTRLPLEYRQTLHYFQLQLCIVAAISSRNPSVSEHGAATAVNNAKPSEKMDESDDETETPQGSDNEMSESAGEEEEMSVAVKECLSPWADMAMQQLPTQALVSVPRPPPQTFVRWTTPPRKPILGYAAPPVYGVQPPPPPPRFRG